MVMENNTIYMFTRKGLEANRVECEIREAGEAIAAGKWDVAIPMMRAISDYINELKLKTNEPERRT